MQLGPWAHAYVWPGDVINIRYVMQGGMKLRSGDYAIEGGRLLTRSNAPLQVVATIRSDEADWPPDVSEAVVVRLQALYLEALCDKPQDARLLKRDAEQGLRDAIIRDKRQEPGLRVDTAPLAEAWRGRRQVVSPAYNPLPVPLPPGPAPGGDPVPFDFADFYNNLPDA